MPLDSSPRVHSSGGRHGGRRQVRGWRAAHLHGHAAIALHPWLAVALLAHALLAHVVLPRRARCVQRRSKRAPPLALGSAERNVQLRMHA